MDQRCGKSPHSSESETVGPIELVELLAARERAKPLARAFSRASSGAKPSFAPVVESLPQ